MSTLGTKLSGGVKRAGQLIEWILLYFMLTRLQRSSVGSLLFTRAGRVKCQMVGIRHLLSTVFFAVGGALVSYRFVAQHDEAYVLSAMAGIALAIVAPLVLHRGTPDSSKHV